jgi:MYXO-CTERM domain-containing protein
MPAAVTGRTGAATTTGSAFTLITPVVLTAGDTYASVLHGHSSGSNYWLNTDAAFRATGNISYGLTIYGNDRATGTLRTLPLTTLNYGLSDIGYQLGGGSSDVPPPAAMPLALLGLGAIGFVARRRKG